MNLCVYVFIIPEIDNFVNKFIEMIQNKSNFSFCTFDGLSLAGPYGPQVWEVPCGKLARFPLTM